MLQLFLLQLGVCYLFPVLLGSRSVLPLILVVLWSVAANPSHPLLVGSLVARLRFQSISIALLHSPLAAELPKQSTLSIHSGWDVGVWGGLSGN